MKGWRLYYCISIKVDRKTWIILQESVCERDCKICCCFQKPGVPLSKGTLITHCYSDLSFLDFICTLVTRAIEVSWGSFLLQMKVHIYILKRDHLANSIISVYFQAYSGHSASCSQLRVIFSFYASTIVPAVEAMDKVSDSFISKILPYVQKVTQQSAALFLDKL